MQRTFTAVKATTGLGLPIATLQTQQLADIELSQCEGQTCALELGPGAMSSRTYVSVAAFADDLDLVVEQAA